MTFMIEPNTKDLKPVGVLTAPPEPIHNKISLPPTIISIISGSFAGMASLVVCHPLDTIRTRMQANLAYKGPMDCFRKTVAGEGIGALYNGLAAPMVAQGIYKAVIFASFGFASSTLNSFKTGKESFPRKLVDVYACGMFAGAANSFVVSPVELVRNRLMVQQRGGGYYYTGVIDCIQQVVKTEGLSTIWKGLSSTILRDGFGVGAWFCSFEICKKALHSGAGMDENSTTILLISGGVGGLGFWIVALPFDTIKSRIQTSQKTNLSIVKIAQELGLNGLYRSLGVAAIRGIPGASIVFFVQKRVKESLTPRETLI